MVAALAFMSLSVEAKVDMPSVFGSGMVLQRNSGVAFWGTAKPSSKVSIRTSWDNAKTVVESDADGKWFTRVQTPEAGGPYTVTVSDGEKLVFDNVLIGEVWFCSGQSNMEMFVKGFKGQPVEGGVDALLDAKPEVPIRMLNVRKCVSATPKDDCDAIWLEHTQDAVANTSATAYFFARDLYRALNIPIGIIVSAWGGTLIEPWMSRDVFEKEFTQYDLSFLDGEKLPEKSQYKPCTLFNGLVHPLIPYTIKGWIWYQGESNRDMYQDYASLQTAYAAMMREKWGNPDMPFYFVQIAPYAFKGKPEGETAAMLMEAQAKSLETIPHSGMATTADLGEKWCIHPAKKQEVGRRLALMALKRDYGLALEGAFAPQYDRMEIRDNGKIVLYFKHNDCGIGPVNEDLRVFEVAGEDHVFYPASGRVMKGYDTIEVTCPAEVQNPVAVRYAFGNYVPGVLRNGRGVAVAPFRTDSWPEKK